jgi:hypothetical protein
MGGDRGEGEKFLKIPLSPPFLKGEVEKKDEIASAKKRLASQ